MPPSWLGRHPANTHTGALLVINLSSDCLHPTHCNWLMLLPQVVKYSEYHSCL